MSQSLRPVPQAAAPAQPDPWSDLRALTRARIALGRCGGSLPTREVLRFSLDHAQARDAVHLPLDVGAVRGALEASGLAVLTVSSAAADRRTYLMRPDLGRRLAPDSRQLLETIDRPAAGFDLAIVVADGLSALAVHRNAASLVGALLAGAPNDWSIAPLVVATQSRVALADEVGELLGARHVAILIGERPGLSSPDSLGIYLTASPRVGRLDSERNCVSNIREGGLDPAIAARKLWWLLREAKRIGATGIALKDESDTVLLAEEPAAGLVRQADRRAGSRGESD
jgi:ethanolamine ammonia-lyase small subunit